jgi:flagellin
MSDITLSIDQQNDLRTLRDLRNLGALTTNRIVSGRKVDSVVDNAVAFFRAQSLSDRATALGARKSNVDQSIQAVQAALDGISAVEGLLLQLKAVAGSSKGEPVSQRISATTEFKTISKQLAQLINDTSYQGLNLLTSTAASLSTQFSERTGSTLTINGVSLLGTPSPVSVVSNINGGLFPLRSGLLASGAWAFAPPIEQDGGVNFFAFNGLSLPASIAALLAGFSNLNVEQTTPNEGIPVSLAEAVYGSIDTSIDGAISQIQAVSSRLGINVDILRTRSSFTSNYSTTLTLGSDKLTLADLNQEAARSQALELRQQLATQSLGSGPSSQEILQLLE